MKTIISLREHEEEDDESTINLQNLLLSKIKPSTSNLIASQNSNKQAEVRDPKMSMSSSQSNKKLKQSKTQLRSLAKERDKVKQI